MRRVHSVEPAGFRCGIQAPVVKRGWKWQEHFYTYSLARPGAIRAGLSRCGPIPSPNNTGDSRTV